MRKTLIAVILAITCLYSYGQQNQPRINRLNAELAPYLYSDTLYKSATGKGIRIQNSYPKGGSIAPDGTQYMDSKGKRYAFTVFWTRVINETDKRLELNINFPADSFAVFSPPNSYLKLILPSDKMSFDKLSSFNYGITGLKPFLDANFHKETRLWKTIHANEEYLFYVLALSYEAAGTPRAGFVLKEQDLFYSISIAPHGSASIPSGKILIKE